MQNTGDGHSFSIDVLAAGIAQGCSAEGLKLYLDSFHRPEVNYQIKWLVKGKHPVLFYAAERNCVDCIKLLLDYGCDPNTCDVDGIPALAYAVMRSKSIVLNPANVVRMLLAFGANPDCIPKNMWTTYLETPKATLNVDSSQVEQAARWCTGFYRKNLVSTLNLSVRYYLHKASQMSIAKGRAMQLARAFNCIALLKVPYLIIGQDYATKRVVNVVSCHLAMQIKTPLVIIFAGLSGHGKTELAKQMGGLLQLPMTVIDCAQMNSGVALFGASPGYAGNSHGSQLNNHLADHSGERSVVFLDEFDKTGKGVHNCLLLVLDSGEYHDRRNNKKQDDLDHATNLGDQEITHFYRNQPEGAAPADKAIASYDSLIETLKARFRDTFGPPMAGRMKNVAPFPFEHNEQAVVVHKFLMELAEQVREPIDISVPNKHYLGHAHLALKNDGKLCAHLANESYIEELGARSLISAMDELRVAFFTSFTDTDELVSDEMNEGPLMKFTA